MMKINGDALRKKAAMVDLISTLYEKVEDARNWDIKTHQGTDEDGNIIWADPENWDDAGWGCLTYREKNDVYEQILKAIEKVAEKI